MVRIKAAALNFFDTLIITGKYQHKPAFPFSPAAEFAGEVESLGPDVTGVSPGDRVIGNIAWGAAREEVAVAADQLVAMPAGLDFERAAGLTVTYGTSLYALKDRPSSNPARRLRCRAPAAAPDCRARDWPTDGRACHRLCLVRGKTCLRVRHGADDGVNYAADDLRRRCAD